MAVGYCSICKKVPIAPTCEVCPSCGNTQWWIKTGEMVNHDACPLCMGNGNYSKSWEGKYRGSSLVTCEECRGSGRINWTEYLIEDTRSGERMWKGEGPTWHTSRCRRAS